MSPGVECGRRGLLKPARVSVPLGFEVSAGAPLFLWVIPGRDDTLFRRTLPDPRGPYLIPRGTIAGVCGPDDDTVGSHKQNPSSRPCPAPRGQHGRGPGHVVTGPTGRLAAMSRGVLAGGGGRFMSRCACVLPGALCWTRAFSCPVSILLTLVTAPWSSLGDSLSSASTTTSNASNATMGELGPKRTN